MKQHTRIITIAAVALMFYPFLSLPEFWSYLFVIIPAFIIAMVSTRLGKQLVDSSEGESDDSLQHYVERLQERFHEQKRPSSAVHTRSSKAMIDEPIQDDESNDGRYEI